MGGVLIGPAVGGVARPYTGKSEFVREGRVLQEARTGDVGSVLPSLRRSRPAGVPSVRPEADRAGRDLLGHVGAGRGHRAGRAGPHNRPPRGAARLGGGGGLLPDHAAAGPRPGAPPVPSGGGASREGRPAPPRSRYVPWSGG